MDTRRLVQISKIAAVAADADDRVLASNEAAAELLGYEGPQIVGREFTQVFRPRDIFNNPLGYDSSLFLGFVEGGSPVRNFQCNLRSASGEYVRTAISIVMMMGPLPPSYQVVYMLWPVQRRRKADEVIARLLNGAGYSDAAGLGEDLRGGMNQSVLTERQVAILRLVADGVSTGEVAKTLSISPETVRNHIRNILSRLDAHSRVEAVSVAYKRHLI